MSFIKVNFIITTIAVILFVSCSNDNFLEERDNPNTTIISHRITAEQAKLNALEFVNNYNKETRNSNFSLTVSEVKAFNIKSHNTRFSNDFESFDSLFYIVNFDDNKGFVIAASDNRETPIYAYIEEGNYNETDSLDHSLLQ